MPRPMPSGTVDGARLSEGRPVASLETPCLVIDMARLEANLQGWQRHMDSCGVRLRPHIKTHKVPAIAELQRRAGAVGIAVAKVGEAEVFAGHGFDDIVIAYPVYGESKWKRIAQLAAGGAKMALNIENEDALRGLARAAAAQGVTVGVQVEIDSGMGRCGLDPGDAEAIARLADAATRLDGVRLEGVTTHRGIFFAGADRMTVAEAGRQEGELIVAVAERLRERGLPVDEVTAGGTITGRAVAEVPGITEVRAGTYVFNDLMQVAFGSATIEDIALSITCTVVSSQETARATVDAGSKTFSGDRGVVGAEPDALPSEVARAVDRDIVVERISEEHGMLRVLGEPVKPGDRLAFFPMHVCTCVNLADELFAARDGVVESVWDVLARGKRT